MSECFVVDEISSNFLLLLLGVDNFFAFGVHGDATTFPVILEPLPVFLSCHTTRSTVGDDEAFLVRFPFIGGVVRKGSGGNVQLGDGMGWGQQRKR